MAQVILGLLITVGAMTIYDLNKQFGAGVSLFYRASLGALRSALAGLLERGEVEVEAVVEGGRAKKRYHVTAAGRSAFREWMLGPITGSDLETAALAKTFFLGALPSTEDRLEVLDDVIERISADRAELEGTAEQLDSLTLPPELALAFGYQRATLDYGLGAHRHAEEFFRRLRDRTAGDEASPPGR